MGQQPEHGKRDDQQHELHLRVHRYHAGHDSTTDVLPVRDGRQLLVRLRRRQHHHHATADPDHGLEPNGSVRRDDPDNHRRVHAQERRDHGRIQHRANLHDNLHRHRQRWRHARDLLLGRRGTQLFVYLRDGPCQDQQGTNRRNGSQLYRHLRRHQADRDTTLVHGLEERPGRDDGHDHGPRLQLGVISRDDADDEPALDKLQWRGRRQLLVLVPSGQHHHPGEDARHNGLQHERAVWRSRADNHGLLLWLGQWRRHRQPHHGASLYHDLHAHDGRHCHHANDELLGWHGNQLRLHLSGRHRHRHPASDCNYGWQPDDHLWRRTRDRADAPDRNHDAQSSFGFTHDLGRHRWRLDWSARRDGDPQVAAVNQQWHDLDRYCQRYRIHVYPDGYRWYEGLSLDGDVDEGGRVDDDGGFEWTRLPRVCLHGCSTELGCPGRRHQPRGRCSWCTWWHVRVWHRWSRRARQRRASRHGRLDAVRLRRRLIVEYQRGLQRGWPRLWRRRRRWRCDRSATGR